MCKALAVSSEGRGGVFKADLENAPSLARRAAQKSSALRSTARLARGSHHLLKMKVQGLEAHSLLFVSLLFGRCACAFFFFFSLPPPSAESGGSPGGRGDIAAVEKKRVGVGALLNPLNPRRARRRKLTREIYCAATDHVEALQFFFHTAIPTLRIAKLFFLSRE